jgi:hypothetical protein
MLAQEKHEGARMSDEKKLTGDTALFPSLILAPSAQLLCVH